MTDRAGLVEKVERAVWGSYYDHRPVGSEVATQAAIAAVFDWMAESENPEYHYIDLFRVIRETAKEDASYPALAKASAKYVASEFAHLRREALG